MVRVRAESAPGGGAAFTGPAFAGVAVCDMGSRLSPEGAGRAGRASGAARVPGWVA
ncbi:hypothetical protein CTE05_22920 [Cellulomonas terrae]|uniref:Uncharacterized protein n=1 Tax=Cellulomonas terrae TaxID=311234 RepID=A0A511JLE7_9CELL|nr:hypothetical protein CTE05_22920 [Cellulomonas terrae]